MTGFRNCGPILLGIKHTWRETVLEIPPKSLKHRHMRTAYRQWWYERTEREVIAITCLSHFCRMMTCIYEHYIISEL